MKRPARFEGRRYLGDKRNQLAYDMEESTDSEASETAIQELMESEKFLAFAPDTAEEVRNRGYKIVTL